MPSASSRARAHASIAFAAFILFGAACGGGEKTLAAPMQEIVVAPVPDGGDVPIASTEDDSPKKKGRSESDPERDGRPQPPIAGDARTAARLKFQQGAMLYSNGDYAKAVKAFEEAYALVPAAPVLFNMGMCYERLGRDREALSVYQRYERELTNTQPASSQLAQVQGRIAALKAKLGIP
jgi:tetratricopeptide (TPR) repeat protein